MRMPSYLPLLRHKQAEWSALTNCDGITRKQIRPIIEATPEMLERSPGTAKRRGISTEALAVQVLWEYLAAEAKRGPLLLDTSLLASVRLEVNGRPNTLLDALGAIGPLPGVAPVVSAKATGVHLSAALRAAESNSANVAVRTPPSLLDAAGFEAARKTARFFAGNSCDVELIVDVGANPESRRDKALAEEIQGFAWLRWTLLGGVFPENLTAFDPDIYLHTVARREWIWWREQRATIGRSLAPSFGDYTVQHATYQPTVRLEGSQSVRYASDDEWIILRGRKKSSFKKRGGKGSQYHAHARFLSRRPEFAGAEYSWGDREIAARAANPDVSQGGAPQWLAFGINHHLVHSASLVASVAT